MAKVIDEYSKLYPATISASDSGRSNGALLVSAKIEIKKTTLAGNKKYKYIVECCLAIISVRFKDPAHKMTGNTVRLIEISYDIICAIDLIEPKNAYFELLAQPAIKIP
jgi:hypothetical protein